jgi:hypothetical protein
VKPWKSKKNAGKMRKSMTQNGDFMGLSQTKVWLHRRKWKLILG